MKLLDLTLPTPVENLACDEALLDDCEDGHGPEVLRFWQSNEHFVVLGYSNRITEEVNVTACREQGIPILRRCSGGGTVLQGPGCLNYSLIQRIDSAPALQTVTGTNRFVMERNRIALATLLTDLARRQESPSPQSRIQYPASGIQHPGSTISIQGHTDLTIDGRKFSGNAQRRKRRAVLFHGSFLLHFDVSMIERLLRAPSKQPDYRQSRSHGEFLMNLNIAADALKAALRQTWKAGERMESHPEEQIRKLVAKKYSVGP